MDKNNLIGKLKWDFAVMAVILILALSAFLILQALNSIKPPGEVVVLQDGEEIGRYSLFDDSIITAHDKDGGYNLMLIGDGQVKVTDADCPDKLCIRQNKISKNGESIICLPHKLVITIQSSEESDLDAVTN